MLHKIILNILEETVSVSEKVYESRFEEILT